MHRRVLIVSCVVAVVLASSAKYMLESTSGRAVARPDESRQGSIGGFATADGPVPAPLASDGRQAAEPTASPRSPAASRVRSTKEVQAAGEQAPPGIAGPRQSAQTGAMIIRSGNAMVEVDSVAAGIARVRRLAQQTGALVANTIVQAGREQQRTASLELRVPSDRFDALVDGLAPIGKVESVNITADDVGEEFVDLSARVANARRLEARLLQLLASRTGQLTDVLSVERELARVREEIERYEGRLRYLQSHVAVSSLTIVVHEPAPVVASHPGQNVIADAFVEAWRRFVLLTAGLIASLGVLVPVAVIGVGAYLIGRRFVGQKPVEAGGGALEA